MQHTLGPWRREGAKGEYIMGPSDLEAIARIASGDSEEREANARLIAAAPELLAVVYQLLFDFPDLEEILAGRHPSKDAAKLIAAAQAAVAKARGQ